MKFFLTALTILNMSINCSPYNTLAVLPTPFQSHYMQVEPIFHGLAARGHNVTVFSPFPPNKDKSNFKHVFLKAETWNKLLAGTNLVEMAQNTPYSLFQSDEITGQVVTEILTSTVFQELIHSDSKFDLIFTELFFYQEALVVLGHIFNAPVVTYSTAGHTPDILRYVGATNAFSYIPHKHLGSQAGPMSLIQRLENALVQSAAMINNEYWNYPKQDALISEHVPGIHPRITDMLGNVSFYFIAADTTIDGTKLYPPNVVDISGLQIADIPPLDKKVKTIMDDAQHGVIYFSYGSTLKMSHFPKEDIQTFLNVFRKLAQPVLWSADLNETDWNIPPNVYVNKWFNQSSVLGHPKCVLFLTHGGISSMMEAIRHAVPIVGIPMHGDQFSNTANAEYYGYGLQVTYANLTETSLDWAIKTVLGDHRFQESVDRASLIFSDKPMSSLNTAIYWIEYVIRHKGAHHLKPLAAQLPWYQLFLLDVILIFSTLFFLLIYIIVKVILLFAEFVSKKSNPVKTKRS